MFALSFRNVKDQVREKQSAYFVLLSFAVIAFSGACGKRSRTDFFFRPVPVNDHSTLICFRPDTRPVVVFLALDFSSHVISDLTAQNTERDRCRAVIMKRA
jgi:hypothetical protein